MANDDSTTSNNLSTTNITAPIDDYLLAVADGIHQAQLKMSQMRIPAQPGQPSIMYQLPRVDFEFKMVFEVAESTNQSSSSKFTLQGRPVNAQNSRGQNSSAEAASILKGSFVSVPTDAGKPPAIINVSLNSTADRQFEVAVAVISATNDPLQGVTVHFNIDQDRSLKLNQREGFGTEGKPAAGLLANTQLWEAGKLFTNESGRAVNTLRVDSQEPLGKYVVIVIDVMANTETIVFRVATEAETPESSTTETTSEEPDSSSGTEESESAESDHNADTAG